MQSQNLANLQGLEQIKNLTEKILEKVASIPQFENGQIFKQKVQEFITDFNKKESESFQYHLQQPYKLRLMFKSDPKPQQLAFKSQGEQKQVKVILSPPNIFVYAFELSCSYKTYEQLIRSEEIQKKVDDIINDYSILKQIGANDHMTIQLVYLSYKRVMIIAPREFIYIRIFFRDQNNEENGVYWIVTFSVPYQVKSDKTRAEVIFTAQKIEENLKQNKIFVKVYSEVDMKTGAKADLAKNKGFSEIKKYIQKLYDYSKTLYC